MTRHVQLFYFWSLNKYGFGFSILFESDFNRSRFADRHGAGATCACLRVHPQRTNDDQADRESGGFPWASKSGKALATGRNELLLVCGVCANSNGWSSESKEHGREGGRPYR